jgi:signal transduction histidine kinase
MAAFATDSESLAVETGDGVSRGALASVLLVAVGFPAIELSAQFTWPGGFRQASATIATMLYLPVHIRLVWYAVRGLQATHAYLSVAWISLVILISLPLIGPDVWIRTMNVVAASALIALPLRRALFILAGCTLIVYPVEAIFPDVDGTSPTFYAWAILWRTSMLVVLVWLIASRQHLQRTSATLAGQAVLRERMQVEAELRDGVGQALADIASIAEHAAGASSADEMIQALRQSSARSRSALADARRLVGSYRRGSLAGELQSAVDILTSVGVRTEVRGDPDRVDDASSTELREELRLSVSKALADPTVDACVIVISAGHDSAATLTVRLVEGSAVDGAAT